MEILNDLIFVLHRSQLKITLLVRRRHCPKKPTTICRWYVDIGLHKTDDHYTQAKRYQMKFTIC